MMSLECELWSFPSKTLTATYMTVHCGTRESHSPHFYCHENLKSHMYIKIFLIKAHFTPELGNVLSVINGIYVHVMYTAGESPTGAN